MHPRPILLVPCLIAIACVSTIGLAPRAASAQSVAVVGVHGGGEQTDDVLRAITEDLVLGFKTAGMDVVYGDELRSRLFSTRDQLVDKVYLEPARQGFEEGRILYEKAQPDEAIDALSRAEGALEGVEEFVRDPRLGVDIQLYLGLAHLSLGNEDDARQAFSEVVRRDPARVLDTLEYPPRIVDLFDSVRSDIVVLDGAELTIVASDNTASRVYVDGRLVGNTPVTADGLPPGVHTVLVDGGANGRYFEEVKVGAGEQRTVMAQIEPRGLALQGELTFEETRSSLTRRLYRELAASAGTDVVAVAAFDEVGDFHCALYSGRSGTFSIDATASLAAAPGARSAFVRQLTERVAIYAEDGGTIRAERVSAESIPLRLGDNPVLNDYLFGAEDRAVAAATTPVPIDPEPRVRRKNPKAAGTVVAILAGVLGAAGAGLAIYAGATAEQPVTGVLVITIP